MTEHPLPLCESWKWAATKEDESFLSQVVLSYVIIGTQKLCPDSVVVIEAVVIEYRAEGKWPGYSLQYRESKNTSYNVLS